MQKITINEIINLKNQWAVKNKEEIALKRENEEGALKGDKLPDTMRPENPELEERELELEIGKDVWRTRTRTHGSGIFIGI